MDKRTFIEKYESLLLKHGTMAAISRHLNIPRSTLRDYLKNKQKHLYSSNLAKPAKQIHVPLGTAKCMFFSAVQDKTGIHEDWLTNLEAYAAYRGGTIHMSSFTYNKRLFEDNRKDENESHYHPRIIPYMDNCQYQIGKNLVWCGEMNTLPTAVSPLTGFESYTKECWGIFPHAKVQLKSIATMFGSPAKQIMTTGATTLSNYVKKRAGILANFHHIIGCVIVEIDEKGRHFCRHIQAEKDGSFYDLEYRVANGKVKKTNGAIEAIDWGDIHLEKLNEIVANVNWGLTDKNPKCIAKTFKPKWQFFEDTTDFTYRNHHSIKDPHFMYRMWYEGTESIEDACYSVGEFLYKTQIKNCESIVKESNHDLAIKRWLKDTQWSDDPVNAEFYLQAQLVLLRAIKAGNNEFSVLEWAVKQTHPNVQASFLYQDESFTICNGSIECGMHGHLGVNGSRGSPRQFTKAGPKFNTAHTHSPGIIDGVYTAGTSSDLNLGYNYGLSSWAHAHVITYLNGKRAIITIQGDSWRG